MALQLIDHGIQFPLQPPTLPISNEYLMIWNDMKSMSSISSFQWEFFRLSSFYYKTSEEILCLLIDITLFPMSSETREQAGERTNKRNGAREQSEQCGASVWVSGTSEWSSTPYVDFLVDLLGKWVICRVLCRWAWQRERRRFDCRSFSATSS